MSNKISSSEKNYKYFVGSMDDDYKIKSLQIMFQKTSTNVKTYADETKLMYLLIEDDNLLKKYNYNDI